MNYQQFFWLHIKKSAGITTRSLLQPYYVEVDRSKKPKCFIQASPEEYNDILNNYRVVLGEYQFRRCLFAKQYLYPNRWGSILSFAFSREPIDRCVSMFYYLARKDIGLTKSLTGSLWRMFRNGKLGTGTAYAFDIFLDHAEAARTSDSIYHPLGIHFTTHTAPMWDDITDLEGNVLLTRVYRLENLVDGINQVFEECGLNKRIADKGTKLNRNVKRGQYSPSRKQIAKIEAIYSRDFELYETTALL